MSTSTPTPRTDAAVEPGTTTAFEEIDCVRASFARTLETKLTAALERERELVRIVGAICDQRDAADAATRAALERERVLREALDFMINGNAKKNQSQDMAKARAALAATTPTKGQS